MTIAVRGNAMALTLGAALAVVPISVTTIATPAPSRAACAVGQTESDSGCVPYCRDDELLDTKSGECLVISAAAG